MAFFDRLFRAKPEAGTHMPPDAPIESIDALRKRARQRLVGSAVLVAAGVSLFAIMFDRQPRPMSLDIPIDIPDKRSAKPLDLPATIPSLAPPQAPAMAASAVTPIPAPVITPQAAPRSSVAVEKSLSPDEKVITPAKPAPAPVAVAPMVAAKPVQKAEPVKADPVRVDPVKPEPAKPVPPKDVPSAEAIRAKALLEGASPQAAKDKTATATPASDASSERFIVQFGSYNEAARAQESRRTVERAGLKTYAQEATTPDGKRIRVRVGPFATRAEAEKAAARIKSLGLPAAILTL